MSFFYALSKIILIILIFHVRIIPPHVKTWGGKDAPNSGASVPKGTRENVKECEHLICDSIIYKKAALNACGF
jgi:hypothetical protein